MEEPVIISLDESFEECPQSAQFVLVGKILSSKILNKIGVQKVIEKAWRTEEEFSISPWKDNVYAFGFKNEDDLCRIISKGPWSVMGSLLILRKWDQSKAFSDLDFSFSPFWIQIHGLPLGFLNPKAGMEIAKSLGEVIAVEEPGERGRLANFMRVRIWVDITKPLKKGFFLRRAKEEDIWIGFKYERLSDFCYGCGRVGHPVNECKEKRNLVAKNWSYDGSLRAEHAVVETIQYGDKPLPKLVYPEPKRRSVVVEGGAYADSLGGRGGDFVSYTNSEGDPRRGAGERTSVRTESCLGATSQLETAGAREEVENILSSRTEEIRQPLGLTSKNLFCNELAQVTNHDGGGKKPTNSQAQYYVEEPDSPRGCFTAQNLGPTEVIRPALLLGPERGLGSLGANEEGLAKAFSSTLNLKRRISDSPEREDKGKKQKISLYKEDGDLSQRMVIGGEELNGYFHRVQSQNRAKSSRGRGRRGGKALAGLVKGRNKGPTLSEGDLFEVEVNCGDALEVDSAQDVPDDRMGEVEQVDLGERALVAGLKQPQARW
ncbi:hypothetical protein RHSIM_Rhsim01G0139400 [Rhododendron simsii]|uniref:CCHC-type domain-containing protein n=1 Tax=Rhododendron simsii TaxID=118357 RepID=A0A834LYZ3_RHOSS|nr:hypothetical protein RHSIM_Rhsim01G0139400 [Rhododendron simsii]